MKVGAAAVLGLEVALLVAACFTPRPVTLALCALAIVITGLAAVVVLRIADRRAKAAHAEIDAELSAFQALMGDLPELAVAMDL